MPLFRRRNLAHFNKQGKLQRVGNPKILLDCPFTTASQFADNSMYARTPSFTGAPAISTTYDANGALKLDNYLGHQEYVFYPADPVWAFIGKDFQIEFDVLSFQLGLSVTVISTYASSGGTQWSCSILSNNKFSWQGFGAMTSTTTFTAGTWYSIKITRIGSAWKLYVNGVQESSATNSIQYTDRGAPLALARIYSGQTSFTRVHMRNLKITQLS